MDPGVLYNAMRRSVRWPAIAGARVRAGTLSERDRAGLGDCLLMDFRRKFFAVSDSSNRYPPASRKLLLKFAEGLAAFAPSDFGKTVPLEGLGRIRGSLTQKSEEILQTIPYTESCTFTGVLLVGTEAGDRGILFHTGDSLLYEVNRKTSESRLTTSSNFWMVGRSKHLFQVEEIEIPPEAILILATDGLADLNAGNPSDGTDPLVSIAVEHPVEEIPDRLVEAIDRKNTPTDDIVIVSVHPHRLRPWETTILLGGTDERGERRYQRRCSQGVLEDRYLPIRQMPSRTECSLALT